MRQTLLRIRLDDLFSTTPLDGITTLGAGWLLLVFVPIYAIWVYLNRKELFRSRVDLSPTALIGLVVILAVSMAPFWVRQSTYFRQHGYAFAPVYGYGFMLFVGFLLATWWAGTRARVVGLSSDNVWDGAMCLLVGGIAGARIWYLIQYHDKVFGGRTGFDKIRAIFELQEGGLVLYGGIVFGSILFTLYCRAKKIDTLLLADVLVPSFFIGLGFGRIGCFLNGCCFGDRCELPWGVRFPEGSVPYEVLASRGMLPPDVPFSMPLHPTQLYSAINAFLIAALLHAYFRYRTRNGSVVALAMATYPITRFVIELLRDDEVYQFNAPLTISQWFSILLCPLGIAAMVWLHRRGPSPHAPPSSGSGGAVAST